MCNGIAIWTDWLLDGSTASKSTVTSGPCSEIELGQIINWDIHSRQGVHLLPHASIIQPQNSMSCDCTFVPADGNIDFKFNMK